MWYQKWVMPCLLDMSNYKYIGEVAVHHSSHKMVCLCAGSGWLGRGSTWILWREETAKPTAFNSDFGERQGFPPCEFSFEVSREAGHRSCQWSAFYLRQQPPPHCTTLKLFLQSVELHCQSFNLVSCASYHAHWDSFFWDVQWALPSSCTRRSISTEICIRTNCWWFDQVVTDLDGNFLLQVGGGGEEGLTDGSFEKATFNRPQVRGLDSWPPIWWCGKVFISEKSRRVDEVWLENKGNRITEEFVSAHGRVWHTIQSRTFSMLLTLRIMPFG